VERLNVNSTLLKFLTTLISSTSMILCILSARPHAFFVETYLR